MTHGSIHGPGRAALLGLVWVMVAGAASCAKTRGPGAGAAGGAGGTGGVSDSGGSGPLGGSGGAGGAAGAEGGAGGTGSGGVSSQGGGGSTSGTGGSPPTDIRCAGNSDCVATGQVCEPATKLCVPCVTTADCPSGGHCLGNRCVSFTPCASKADCTAGQVCDPTRGVCVQCVAEQDCPADHECSSYKCVPVLECQYNSDCPTNICDNSNFRCIDCLGDSTCGANRVCLLNVCRTVCKTNADCASLGMVCDTSVNACKQCVSNKDCPASWNCLMTICVPDLCDTTQSACSGTSVAGCNTDGDVFNNFTSCATGKACTARGAVAGCGGTPIRDGGAPDVATPPGDAAVGSCSGGTAADPCKTGLPKLAGSQTVDGNGGELCSLPFVVLNAQSAAKIINYNNVPTSQFETATARIAWDASGVHAYVDVQDASVQTASMADPSQATAKAYQGDSVELFFSSSNNLTGLTSQDSNSIHVIIPANGPAVSVKDTGNSGTATALPAAQFAQANTATGYAIEVSIPWPGSAPSAGGAIRFDLALNSADKSFTSIDKMRDGQLIHYVGTVSGSTTCQGADGAVPWCDNRTWCQTTVQ